MTSQRNDPTKCSRARRTFRLWVRAVALWLIAILSSQSAVLAVPVSDRLAVAARSAVSTPSPYIIPSSVAWTGPLQVPSGSAPDDGAGGALTIILIEDAHTNPSGQMNLAAALESVIRHHRLPVIFTEGSDGDVSISDLRKFGTAEERARTVAPFVRRGELKGSEYLQITGAEDFEITGVEDRRLYEAAVGAYARAAGSRAKLKALLDRVEISMDAVAERLLGPGLSGLYRLREAYGRNEVSSADYFAGLTVLADDSGITRSSMEQLARLERVRRIERTLDFEKAAAEWAQALRSLPPQEREALEQAGVGMVRKNGLEAAAAAGGRMRLALGQRPVRGALGRYLRYLQAVERLDPRALLEQAAGLEARLEEALAVTPDESRFIRMRRVLTALREMSDLSAAPAAIEFLDTAGSDADLQRIAAFLNRQILRLGVVAERAILYEQVRAEGIRHARDFYRTAFERDRTILDRTVQKAKERGVSEAVLITGGFHTPHLVSLILERGMSVRIITPQVYEPTDRVRYERLLLDRVSRSGAEALDPVSALITPYAAETPSTLSALRKVLEPLAEGARMAGRSPDEDELPSDAPLISRREFAFWTALGVLGSIGGVSWYVIESRRRSRPLENALDLLSIKEAFTFDHFGHRAMPGAYEASAAGVRGFRVRSGSLVPTGIVWKLPEPLSLSMSSIRLRYAYSGPAGHARIQLKRAGDPAAVFEKEFWIHPTPEGRHQDLRLEGASEGLYDISEVVIVIDGTPQSDKGAADLWIERFIFEPAGPGPGARMAVSGAAAARARRLRDLLDRRVSEWRAEGLRIAAEARKELWGIKNEGLRGRALEMVDFIEDRLRRAGSGKIKGGKVSAGLPSLSKDEIVAGLKRRYPASGWQRNRLMVLQRRLSGGVNAPSPSFKKLADHMASVAVLDTLVLDALPRMLTDAESGRLSRMTAGYMGLELLGRSRQAVSLRLAQSPLTADAWRETAVLVEQVIRESREKAAADRAEIRASGRVRLSRPSPEQVLDAARELQSINRSRKRPVPITDEAVARRLLYHHAPWKGAAVKPKPRSMQTHVAQLFVKKYWKRGEKRKMSAIRREYTAIKRRSGNARVTSGWRRVDAARMALAAGDWKVTVLTTRNAETNRELFAAAHDLTGVPLSDLEARVSEVLGTGASGLTGEVDLNYLSEGMWKRVFILRLMRREGGFVPIAIKRAKFHDSFAHDEAAVIRRAQGKGAPALILEIPSSSGLFQYAEEYVDGPSADELWASGSPDLDVRLQLVRSILSIARALGGEVPRDYLNRHNYIVERSAARALLVDLGNRRMKVAGDSADPWEQIFFMAGLVDRFADNDPGLMRDVVLRSLSEEWGTDEAKRWVSMLSAHLMVPATDDEVVEKLGSVARPEEFKSEDELMRAWRAEPLRVGRLKEALKGFLAEDPTGDASSSNADLEGRLRHHRSAGVVSYAAVLGMDELVLGRPSEPRAESVWDNVTDHLRSGGRVVWYSNFTKELWFERFYPSWREHLLKAGLWEGRGDQNSFLLNSGRELLIDDPASGGFRVILNHEPDSGADPIKWTMDRLSDVENIRIGPGVIHFDIFSVPPDRLGRDLGILRSFSVSREAGPVNKLLGATGGSGSMIELDERTTGSGFVWSGRRVPGSSLWDPDNVHLMPFFTTHEEGRGVSLPQGTQVYAVYQVPSDGVSAQTARGRWIVHGREVPASSGARMTAAPADPDLRVSGPIISLNVRDLGAVPLPLPKDAAEGSRPSVGVDMMKGLRTARGWLSDLRQQGIGRVYLVGLAASGDMSGLSQSDWREPKNRKPGSMGSSGPLFYYGNPANLGAAGQLSGWLKNRKAVDGHQFDNEHGGNVFSVMDLRLIHEGNVPAAPTSEQAQRVLEEELRGLIRDARGLGIDVYVDFIPWRAPESVTAENYKSFFWRELSPDEEKEYAQAVAEEKRLFPGGHGKRYENRRYRSKPTPTERWITEVLKKAGPFIAVRIPLADGGEKLVFVRRADIGIDSEDQVVPNALHPQTIAYYIESLKRFADLGVAGVRVDLGFRLLPGFIRPYYEEMRSHLSKRGQGLEDWMRQSGIRTIRKGETFDDWWERQKNTAQPLREILSVIRHHAREMDFVMEAYPYQSHEQKELLALGVDHNYDDSLFKGMLHALRNQSEALPDALRGALARAPHGTLYASNFDEDSLARILKKIGRPGAVTGIRLLLAVMPRLGVPVLYTEREFLGLDGSAVPMPGGSDPDDDSHHPFPGEGEFAERLKPGWAQRAIRDAAFPSLLRSLEETLGPRTVPQEVWIPVNTSAKNRLVPMFWRDAAGDWCLAVADLYPEWGSNTGFGPGRIKIELDPDQMPAGLDPALFAGPGASQAPVEAWSQSPFWRIGTGDWHSRGSVRTLDIDVIHERYQGFNMVLKLGPGRAVKRSGSERPAAIWEPGREPRARERALLKLLTVSSAGDPDAVNATLIALSYPDDNLRAQAANILARRSLVSRSPLTDPDGLAGLMMDPLAPYRAAGVAIPQAYLNVYPDPVARQWLVRNGRYSLMHVLKHLSILARGGSDEQFPGDADYAAEVMRRFRAKLAADAAGWDPGRDAVLRREAEHAVQETRTVHPVVEWDRDLGVGSPEVADLAELFRLMVIRSEVIADRYPKDHRDTFYWVLEAVREILPDKAGDPAADAVYRGVRSRSGARMAEGPIVSGGEEASGSDAVLVRAVRRTRLEAENGLHARPIGTIVNMVDWVGHMAVLYDKQEIRIQVRRAGDEKASWAMLDSILELMTEGITDGTALDVEVEGALAQEQADQLADIFADFLSDRAVISNGLRAADKVKKYRDRILRVFDPSNDVLSAKQPASGARMTVVGVDEETGPALAVRRTRLDAENGLHNRPSMAIYHIAKFAQDAASGVGANYWIRVRKAGAAEGEGSADPVSILSLITLGVTDGTELKVEVGGSIRPDQAQALAGIFADLLSDRITLSEGLNHYPEAAKEYKDRIRHVFRPDTASLSAPLEHNLALKDRRILIFLGNVIKSNGSLERAHVTMEGPGQTMAVFRIWREGQAVWYALKGQTGRIRIEPVGPELPEDLPVYTAAVDTDSMRGMKAMTASQAVGMDLALAEELMGYAAAFSAASSMNEPIRVNVELDGDDLVRRTGYPEDEDNYWDFSQKDLWRRLGLLQDRIHERGSGRLILRPDDERLPNVPTVRLVHERNPGFAATKEAGDLIWSYIQEESQILPVLSSTILSALIAAAPAEGREDYLADLTPVYQQLTGSDQTLTPQLIEEARHDPRRLAPIRPLTLHSYLDVAVYLQELSRKSAAASA